MQEDYKCMRLSHRANILLSAINLRQNGKASKTLFLNPPPPLSFERAVFMYRGLYLTSGCCKNLDKVRLF